jgi:hypothetical protein
MLQIPGGLKGMKRSTVILMLLLISHLQVLSQEIPAKKIWDGALHNAFTDIIRYKSYFYCSFREGINHVHRDTTGNGKVRVLRSKDGEKWESTALLSDQKYDLRDPKLSVTPDNRLMVVMGGSYYVAGTLTDMISHVSFSDDGLNFSKPVPVLLAEGIRSKFDWLWRITWNGSTGYCVDYQPRQPDNKNRVRLLSTRDGRSFDQVCELEIDSLPGESTIRFDRDNRMMILVRRETGAMGKLGISTPPYKEWKWITLSYRLGGPNFLVLDDGRLCVGSRLYETGGNKTIIYVTDNEGKAEKIFLLPSGGDTSYPGLLIYKKYLWISYYSSHEGKASIYLAKIRVRDLIGISDK